MTDTLRPPTFGATPPPYPVYGTVTVHDRSCRRHRMIAAVLVVAVAVTAVVVWWAGADSRRDYLSTGGWPAHGQGAYQLDGGMPHVSDNETPVPIASLAKVMTAYLVLSDLPLRTGHDGPSLLVTTADVRDTARRRAQDESVVAVSAGEHLTERQALLAILLPSANNVAVMVTRWSTGTVADFVERMNRTARRLGMTHTTYTDPSGFDERTVSTAADQLELARAAAANSTLTGLMALRTSRIPVAGTIANTDVLLGHDGFVGMKTGSDDAAGGCFLFHVRRTVDGRTADLLGVVLGQRGRRAVTAGQYAARQLADRVLRKP